MTIVETLSNSVKDLDRKSKAKETEFNKDTRKEWQRREYIEETSVIDQIKKLR